MTRVAVIVRMMMLVACVVPFTSTRQAMAAFPLKAANTSLPAAPFLPAQEEEDTERHEEVTGKEKARTSLSSLHRPRAVRGQNLYSHATTRLLAVITSSPAPLDPFRNGLGCPFRC